MAGFFKNLSSGFFSPFAWISSLLGKNTQSGLSSLYNKFTGAGLTGAESEANRFNAEQAQIQRDWETEMSNTSYQRQVADMQAAGLNPALMYGGAGSSGASTPSGSAGSSVSPGAGLDPISAIMDMALLKSQIENINADTRLKGAEASGTEIENTFKPSLLEQNLRRGEVDIQNIRAGIDLVVAQLSQVQSQTRLNEAQIHEVMSIVSKNEIETANERLRSAGIESSNALIAQNVINAQLDAGLKIVESAVMKSQIGLNNAQAKSVGLDVVYKEFEKEFREKFGTNPDQAIWNGLLGILGKASDEISGIGLPDVGFGWIKDYLYKIFE